MLKTGMTLQNISTMVKDKSIKENEHKKRALNILQILSQTKRKTMLGEFQEKKLPAFQMLIATILSARAKDETTMPISRTLFKKYSTAEKLAKAKPDDVKRIIRKIGFFNNKTKSIIACAQMLLDEYDRKVPDTMEELLKLPGVGRKVAGCVLVYGFNQDAIPVDTHVHRISNRLGLVNTTNPEKTEFALMKLYSQKYWRLINDTLVHHGKTICKPIGPKCTQCLIQKLCHKKGVKK